MIDYANELIEEIKSNKPSDATMITVNGAPIERIRYNGVNLNIETSGCYDCDCFHMEEEE